VARTRADRQFREANPRSAWCAQLTRNHEQNGRLTIIRTDRTLKTAEQFAGRNGRYEFSVDALFAMTKDFGMIAFITIS
jgi:hypothetical protein